MPTFAAMDRKPAPKPNAVKSKLHRRNKHKHRYNFKKLIELSPELGNYVAVNKYGVETIDFFNATAVKLLNKSLLQQAYDITHWDIPQGYLCPPIPGRADYIHHIADVLASENNKRIPKGPRVRVLDVGTGANCIYPIIGQCEYGWDFVASDIDPKSVKSATAIAKANDLSIDVRLQKNTKSIFRNIIQDEEFFELTICNPPFHSSAQEAINSNRRKTKNLTKGKAVDHKGNKPKEALSFGGQHNELWCEGGELSFIQQMIKESKEFKHQVHWFSTLVSKHGNLKPIYEALRQVNAKKVKTVAMGQGNKSSRLVAWKY